MNNIDDLVEIYECPLCGGAGILEEDCGSSYYVTCLECGCHSVNIDFKSDDDRLDAAKRTADLWNCGKVISMSPDHDKQFTVAVLVDGERVSEGEGHTKKAAEQQAAYQALLLYRNRE